MMLCPEASTSKRMGAGLPMIQPPVLLTSLINMLCSLDQTLAHHIARQKLDTYLMPSSPQLHTGVTKGVIEFCGRDASTHCQGAY